MTLPIKSILGCLVILAAASDIHTQEIREMGRPEVLAELKDAFTVLGRGVEPGQLPIIAYHLAIAYLHVSVHIIGLTKVCKFKFYVGSAALDGIQKLVQLGGKSRIVLVWNLQSDKRVTRVSIIDTLSCANTKNLEWELPTTEMLEVVPFVDGFDVITSKNTFGRYNADGKLIAGYSFPINSNSFLISASSERMHDKGLFVVDYHNAVLNLVNEDGTSGKPLLKFTDKQFKYSDNDESLFSVCWFDINLKNVIKCYQYDQAGTEMWNDQVSLSFNVALLDVKNLAGGGLMLAASNSEGNQLFIVEMGRKPAKTWYYPAEQAFKVIRLTDFNKNNRMFALAYISQNNLEAALLQRFSIHSPKVN